MKKVLFVLAMLFFCNYGISQQENPLPNREEIEQKLENLAEQQNLEPEDDSYLQTLVDLKKNKLNLNTAGKDELQQLQLLSDLQIDNFIKYRLLLGSLLSIYELQSIPTWDIPTIQKLLPFVIVGTNVPFTADLKTRLTRGNHTVLMRAQQVIEKSNGYLRPDTVAIRYPGSPQKIFVRYKYNFQNILQYGITAEKDAGEQFFKGGQKQGFDFYSAHFFARKLGLIKTLALGDFSVNMGQGLIQWQSLGFKKSADIEFVKRQGEILHPYNSSGEYNFMRGAGITLGVRNIQLTTFASVHKLDGTLNSDTSQASDDFISSILNSGYHRTSSEVAKKNTITQTSYGGNLSYDHNNIHLGLNSIFFKFSVPLVRNIYPYNQWAIQGSDWRNYSMDYSYTYRNFHFFGEAATDKNNSKAFVGGLLASLDEKVDASLVYRNISEQYQSLYGNAFTESTAPNNEKGLFTGISLKPAYFLTINAYADVFSFPWLRYRVDAPGSGSDYLLEVSYNPNKRFTAYSRFKSENKAINATGTNLPVRQVAVRPKESWRTEWNYKISRQLALSERIEMVWYNRHEKELSQRGFLIFVDGKYKPAKSSFTLDARVQYFITDGFDSRLYAFENDLLYSYSIPQFAGKGFRYYINANCNFTKKVGVGLRFAETYYPNQTSISSGLDKIAGNKKSEIKLQVSYNF